MSALRYLTKVVFILCMVLLYQPAHAQILTINVRPEKFTLPEGLLENLERCTPYHIERPLRHRDTVVNTVYTIDGLQDGLCNLHITGVTNSSVETSDAKSACTSSKRLTTFANFSSKFIIAIPQSISQ